MLVLVSTSLAGEFFTLNARDNELERFDTTTGEFADVGPLGWFVDYGDLAWDPATRSLFMIDGRESEGLFTVDITTGDATLVGYHGVTDLFGLTVDPSTGVLYASAAWPPGLYALNRFDGSPTLVGSPGVGLDDLAFDLAGDLYGLAAATGDIYQVSVIDGSAALVHDGDWVGVHGWDQDPATGLFWALDESGDVYSYDPVDWSRELVIWDADAPTVGVTYFGEGGGPILEVGGDCPGHAAISGRGLTPGAHAAIVYGAGLGADPIPAGPCSGTLSGLSSMGFLGAVPVDVAGEVFLTPELPDGVCGLVLQFLDLETCEVTLAQGF